MRTPPTTVELFEELALREPRAPAFAEEGEGLDRGQLHAMLVRCALLLQRLGVRRGDRIAVSGPGFGIQLVVLLAAEGIGAVTASFQAEGDPDAEFLFSQVQWVFSAREQVLPVGVRFQLLDAALVRELAQPLGSERPAWEPLGLHEPQRITRTSGSSGRSKFMVLSRQAQEQWVATGIEKNTYRPGTRLLVLGPLVMNAAFTRSSACLRRGGMVLAGGRGADLPALRPTHVWGLPLQLETLLREAPPGYVAPEPVRAATVGGAVSPALREQVERMFRAPIKNRYGSNEAGGICEELDAGGTGILCAGVEVRILGPQGEDLPAGQAGAIAVRTAALAEGYLQRPEETAAAFRDGWFVSGDYGVLVGYRQLRLLGRHDDLVNIGGLKYPAADVEADLRKQPAIAECAVQAVELEDSDVSLGVAVVCAQGASRDEAVQQLRTAIEGWGSLKMRVVFVEALPRLAAGKVDRMALLRLLREPSKREGRA
ncbi:acyl--CoA ligase [Ramlibacter sp. XY19]|uniref:class I adenylate-forming enzyme family protein n=1 Tax=Ramlibacter paludis TaxID=2908000 RepID=UPI0023D9F591|nr:class I adenylate-forming enzyme family protein [Ramlibacter paludis]MCG2592965.1 acyl--CoA ligase [Ramlibacter paludis]